MFELKINITDAAELARVVPALTSAGIAVSVTAGRPSSDDQELKALLAEVSDGLRRALKAEGGYYNKLSGGRLTFPERDAPVAPPQQPDEGPEQRKGATLRKDLLLEEAQVVNDRPPYLVMSRGSETFATGTAVAKLARRYGLAVYQCQTRLARCKRVFKVMRGEVALPIKPIACFPLPALASVLGVPAKDLEDWALGTAVPAAQSAAEKEPEVLGPESSDLGPASPAQSRRPKPLTKNNSSSEVLAWCHAMSIPAKAKGNSVVITPEGHPTMKLALRSRHCTPDIVGKLNRLAGLR